MKMKPSITRTLTPVLSLTGSALVSYLVYFGLRGIGHHVIHPPISQALAALSGLVYFLSIAFGPLYVYLVARLRGASVRLGIALSFVVPCAWMTKEVFRLTSSHPFIECLYWYLNPLHIWLILLIVAELGIAEILARRVLLRRGEGPGTAWQAPAMVVLCSIAVFVMLYMWGRGENLYVIFLEGYRLLFGTGL